MATREETLAEVKRLLVPLEGLGMLERTQLDVEFVLLAEVLEMLCDRDF